MFEILLLNLNFISLWKHSFDYFFLIMENVYNRLAMYMAYTSAYIYIYPRMFASFYLKKIKILIENNKRKYFIDYIVNFSCIILQIFDCWKNCSFITFLSFINLQYTTCNILVYVIYILQFISKLHSLILRFRIKISGKSENSQGILSFFVMNKKYIVISDDNQVTRLN